MGISTLEKTPRTVVFFLTLYQGFSLNPRCLRKQDYGHTVVAGLDAVRV